MLDLVLARGAAVSYTHLRAHETVLDLVCRLLLEKKKKRKKKKEIASKATRLLTVQKLLEQTNRAYRT